MSHPSRPRSRVPALRRRREHRIEIPQQLEDRRLLAPFLPLGPDTVTFTAAPTPTNPFLGTVTITPFTGTTTVSNNKTAAPTTSVSLFTPITSFGGDIVRIKAGPGGVFGDGVYAISRGAGGNTGAINRPGVIYRVDPTTGKASVFFDLNTVLNQLEPPSGNASNSVGASTGLVNWYDIAFDPEGYFDGKPSMFVASVDRSDPNKNVIYRIGPDGSFMGAFVQFTAGQNALKFNINPSAILVPPPQDQQFLRGLIAGSGISSTGGTFSALFFDSNAYRPGQNLNSTNLPTGVNPTNLIFGPQVGLTASNPDYLSAVYSAFTDFGTPAAGGIPARAGFSGVQGINGELLIANANPIVLATPPDQRALDTTPFRRFQDIAFDQYGYFSQGYALSTSATTTGGGGTGGGGGATGGGNGGNTVNGLFLGNQIYAGSVFVSDLATGDQVVVTPVAPLPTTPQIRIPIQGPGPVGVTTDASGQVVPIVTNGNTTGGSNLGGRIIRIDPEGNVSVFAEGFNTSGAQDSTSFLNSELSISFSADGTILYASDNDGIWQFKTVQDIADAQSGQVIGLNDLRALGVPYDGQGSAVAVIDTGVDVRSAPFRGRVSQGTNVVTNGFGNDDTAPGASTGTTGTGGTGGGGATGGGNTVTGTTGNGHGTLVAGVVAQFVPEATIVPVDVFSPFLATGFSSTTTGGGGTGGTGGTTSVTQTSNATSSTQYVYQGMDYIAKHPFVSDPVRPGKVDRVVASVFGFGTLDTFQSEGTAYRQFPQIVLSLKSKLQQLRNLGIAPIAAAGQFGAPFLAGARGTTGGTGGGTTTTGSIINGSNNSQNTNVGDANGMALPAVLNQVVSVTATYPFPFQEGPDTPPTQPNGGVIPRPLGPILLYSNGNLGGTPGSGSTTGGGGGTGTGTTTTGTNLQRLTNADLAIYVDRIMGSANRSATTDYAAPGIDVPTFRLFFNVVGTTTTNGTTSAAVDPRSRNVFQEAGTSLSAGIVTGSFALISSALDYWSKLNGPEAGVTSDAYLTEPVGVRTLNFGPHAFRDLTAYNNPDGINAILAWTSVPATDPNDNLSASTPPYLVGQTNFRQFASIDIGNAVAAIEGTEAINYLFKHNIFPIIDSNHNGLITAQEIQDFVDNAAKMGMPEAGAMARLLGGTARTPGDDFTAAGEQPDEPDVLQRRFNFFDYAANGQLQGSVSIQNLRMLAHTLLPPPDAFMITNRPRASANGFLVAPGAHRNFQDLQHLSRRFEFVPETVVARYKNISPARFRVNRGIDQAPGQAGPLYALFGPPVSNGSNSSSSTSTSTPASQPTLVTQNASSSTQGNGSSGTGSSTATPPSGSSGASSSTAGATSTTSGGTQSGSQATTTTTQTPTTTTATQSPSSLTPGQQLLALVQSLAANANSSGNVNGSGNGSTSTTTGTNMPPAQPISGLGTMATTGSLAATPAGQSTDTTGSATTPSSGQAGTGTSATTASSTSSATNQSASTFAAVNAPVPVPTPNPNDKKGSSTS